MTLGDPVPLKLLQHLQKALSHTIRTPLSVISNDLQFLQMKSEDPELNRTLAQCKKITELLSGTAMDAATKEALDSHLAHLASWKRREGAQKNGIVLRAAIETDRESHFLLFSEAFNEILSQDSVHAPIVDALCLSMGITISGTITPKLIEVELTFPA